MPPVIGGKQRVADRRA